MHSIDILAVEISPDLSVLRPQSSLNRSFKVGLSLCDQDVSKTDDQIEQNLALYWDTDALEIVSEKSNNK